MAFSNRKLGDIVSYKAAVVPDSAPAFYTTNWTAFSDTSTSIETRTLRHSKSESSDEVDHPGQTGSHDDEFV
jgi:hypothetical protein